MKDFKIFFVWVLCQLSNIASSLLLVDEDVGDGRIVAHFSYGGGDGGRECRCQATLFASLPFYISFTIGSRVLTYINLTL